MYILTGLSDLQGSVEVLSAELVQHYEIEFSDQHRQLLIHQQLHTQTYTYTYIQYMGEVRMVHIHVHTCTQYCDTCFNER